MDLEWLRRLLGVLPARFLTPAAVGALFGFGVPRVLSAFFETWANVDPNGSTALGSAVGIVVAVAMFRDRVSLDVLRDRVLLLDDMIKRADISKPERRQIFRRVIESWLVDISDRGLSAADPMPYLEKAKDELLPG